MLHSEKMEVFQASATKSYKPWLSGDVAWHGLAVGYWYFGTICLSYPTNLHFVTSQKREGLKIKTL